MSDKLRKIANDIRHRSGKISGLSAVGKRLTSDAGERALFDAFESIAGKMIEWADDLDSIKLDEGLDAPAST